MRIVLVLLVALLAGCFGSPSGADTGPGPEQVTGEPGSGVRLVKVVDTGPALLDMVPLGDGSGGLLLVHQKGQIDVLRGGALSDFADLSARVNAGSSERGLLSIALAPDFATTGLLYADYTGAGGATYVSRFSVVDGVLDPASEEVLLSVDQPFANHNGGHILFGPDGMFYVSLGDGGAAGDPMLNGQNPATLLGSILRLDVSGEGPYTVPSDNPFVGDPTGADEVWAYGLRNAWRMSFDTVGNESWFWTADVGQNAWEEVNRVPADAAAVNYGWNIFEGSRHYPAGDRPMDVPGLTYPITEYDHDAGCSVTGGHVYRGASVPDLAGRYVFGDYCSGTIWSIPANATGPVEPEVLLETELRVSGFAIDEAGELYVLHHGGTLYRFEAGS